MLRSWPVGTKDHLKVPEIYAGTSSVTLKLQKLKWIKLVLNTILVYFLFIFKVKMISFNGSGGNRHQG